MVLIILGGQIIIVIVTLVGPERDFEAAEFTYYKVTFTFKLSIIPYTYFIYKYISYGLKPIYNQYESMEHCHLGYCKEF